MKKTIFTASLLLTSLITGIASAQQTGNGGFLYNGIDQAAVSFISYQLDWVLPLKDEVCLNESLSDAKLKKVDLEKLAHILATLRFSFTEQRTRRNENGVLLPLIMDYGQDKNGPYIIALRPFFDRFASRFELNGDLKDSEIEKEMMELVYHEAAHHFGYSDKEAREFVGEITHGGCSRGKTSYTCTAVKKSDSPLGSSFQLEINEHRLPKITSQDLGECKLEFASNKHKQHAEEISEEELDKLVRAPKRIADMGGPKCAAEFDLEIPNRMVNYSREDQVLVKIDSKSAAFNCVKNK